MSESEPGEDGPEGAENGHRRGRVPPSRSPPPGGRSNGDGASLAGMTAPIDHTDVFADVYGHQGAKLILRNALRNGKSHILMVGPPGSGKSAFLMSLERNLPGVEYWDSKALNASKLQEILASNPPILLLDEFDRLSMECYDVLSIPMEHGRIQKGTSREEYDKRIDTQILASANPTDRIPGNIRSRVKEIHFEQYSKSEYMEVCQRMLVDTCDWVETPTQAREVANIAYQVTESTDPRHPRDIANLADSFDEVDKVAKALHDPDAEIGGVSLSPMEIAQTQEQVQRKRLAQIAARDAAESIGRRFGRDVEAETPADVKQEIEEAVDEEVARHAG